MIWFRPDKILNKLHGAILIPDMIGSANQAISSSDFVALTHFQLPPIITLRLAACMVGVSDDEGLATCEPVISSMRLDKFDVTSTWTHQTPDWLTVV